MYGYYGHGGYYDDLSKLFGLTFNASQIVKFKVFKIHMFSQAVSCEKIQLKDYRVGSHLK